MPDLGRKYTCYSCHTKFYDLGKAEPLCPKCGADQRDAEEHPVVTPSRSRASRAAPVVVEEPAEEPEFAPEGETPGPAPEAGDEEEEGFVARDEEPEEEEEEEEEY